jgi:hypothetical protein
MNRATVEIIFVVTIASNLIVYSVTKPISIEANAIALQTTSISNQSPQVIRSTSRLVHHSKMIALESMLIARYSVNLMFDKVVKAF